ncbi:hypothetical protein AGMMS49525_04030 [Bacteroidia bacterium]|nr:hypothetical protein AGMMS49525_04030 [Bacteroidia bacterium]
MIQKIANYLFLLLGVVLLQACDENARSPIPDVSVYFTIDLNYLDRELGAGTAPAAKSFTEPRRKSEEGKIGFGGLLVINGFSTNGASVNLFAYDLACPSENHPVNRNVRVVPDNAGKAICPNCGAVFITAYGMGMPESGSKFPLKSYSVRQSGYGGMEYIVRN